MLPPKRPQSYAKTSLGCWLSIEAPEFSKYHCLDYSCVLVSQLHKLDEGLLYWVTTSPEYLIMKSRRKFILDGSACALGLSLLGCQEKPQPVSMEYTADLFFDISLAQWSLHKMLQAGKLKPKDFPRFAKERFGIHAVEYVNQFYTDYGLDPLYWRQLKQRTDDLGVANLLIMVDDEGELGSPVDHDRLAAVQQHHKWVDAAKELGCHSIRINAFGEGSKEEVASALVDGLGRLCGYAADRDINVLIENHGLYSSDAQWVADVIQRVGMDNCGTLPDFGNWCTSAKWGGIQDGSCEEVYDLYEGVTKMMPYAKGVSAKSYDFDEQGGQPLIDYARMMNIVKNAGYTGYIGIEYEGSRLGEEEGIMATKELLLQIGNPS